MVLVIPLSDKLVVAYQEVNSLSPHVVNPLAETVKCFTNLKPVTIMASTSETGHAKNAANFEDLISFCTGYGVTYNPSKVAIKLPGLTTLSTNANAALQAVKVAKTAYDNTTNAREVAFKPLKPLATKIVNALAATDSTVQTLDDVKTSNNKIQGRRAKVIKEPEAGAALSAPD